jgi:hypothetical protein
MTVARRDRPGRRTTRSATRSFILTKEPQEEEREVSPGILTTISFLVAGVTLLYLASSLILAAGS